MVRHQMRDHDDHHQSARQGSVRFTNDEARQEYPELNEEQWDHNVDWSFAISATEISQAQYVAEIPDYRDYQNEYVTGDSFPANAMKRLDAIKFCRKLSERDGISEAEMAIPSIDKLKKGPYPEFRNHQGYRLPIEVEWEIACRAGTITPRFYGHAPELLSSYAALQSEPRRNEFGCRA